MGEFERYFTEKGREQGMKQGMKQGRKEEKLENIKALMESLKVSAQEAMGLLKITPEEQQKLGSEQLEDKLYDIKKDFKKHVKPIIQEQMFVCSTFNNMNFSYLTLFICN